LWPMADRLDVVAVRIEDESPIVARMVLGPKPRTTAVAPTRRYGHLMEGINSGALLGSRRGVKQHSPVPSDTRSIHGFYRRRYWLAYSSSPTPGQVHAHKDDGPTDYLLDA